MSAKWHEQLVGGVVFAHFACELQSRFWLSVGRYQGGFMLVSHDARLIKADRGLHSQGEGNILALGRITTDQMRRYSL